MEEIEHSVIHIVRIYAFTQRLVTQIRAMSGLSYASHNMLGKVDRMGPEQI